METTKVNIKKIKEDRKNKYEGGSKRGYKLIDNGRDAILTFGKFKDMAISDIAVTEEYYLKWIIEQTDFDKELKKICGISIGYADTEIF